jgi:Rrf2 family transcriptional regulator, iron-sulfur cluster assembly transcription factor
MARDPRKIYPASSLVGSLHISDKYLRRLMTDLTKAGFIYSVQGRDGGYAFAKKTSRIHLSEIIDAVEGMDKYTGCVMGFEQCSEKNPCVMHSTWVKVRQEFISSFSSMSLDDLDFSKINKF